MRSRRITTEKPDLSPVFGRLDSSVRTTVVTTLARAEERLFALRRELTARANRSWRSRGIYLETFPSGQACIGGYVQDGDLTFAVELRPQNFFHEAPWRPGEPLRKMATDAWDVDASVYVVSDATIDAGQETAAKLPVRRLTDPKDAVGALVVVCTDVHQLALSRPAEVDAWRSFRG
jgi:hypothetical protein